MGTIGTYLKNIILVGVLVLLFTPYFEKKYSFIKEIPLAGAYVAEDSIPFSWPAWFSGKYQQSDEKLFNSRLGFHNTLTRFHNQVDFSLFNLPNVKSVIAGKSGYLYEDYYIMDWLGADRMSPYTLNKKLEAVRNLQTELKKRNVDFVLAFSPSKARLYPEYIPDRFTRGHRQPSNYELYTNLLNTKYKDIHFLDLTNYLMQVKKTTKIPVYSKVGTHWTLYSSQVLVVDTLIRYLEVLRNIRMPHFVIDSSWWTAKVKPPDDDILGTMNLLFPRTTDTLPYAKLKLSTTRGTVKPRLLAVTDSYYWNIFNHPLGNSIFERNDFWYYNSIRYPEYEYKNIRNSDIDALRKNMLSHDVVLLCVTEANLSTLFTFAETALTWLDPNNPEYLKSQIKRKERIDFYKNQIKGNPNWIEMVKKKAKEKNATLEEAIQLDAEYMYDMELREAEQLKQNPK